MIGSTLGTIWDVLWEAVTVVMIAAMAAFFTSRTGKYSRLRLLVIALAFGSIALFFVVA